MVDDQPEQTTEIPVFKPLCIWCSAPWSDQNIRFEDAYMSSGCDTCGYGSVGSATLVIICHECGREMYRKEGHLGH